MSQLILNAEEREMIRDQACELVRSLITKAADDWRFCHFHTEDTARRVEAALRQDERVPDYMTQAFARAFREEAWREMARIRGAMSEGGAA